MSNHSPQASSEDNHLFASLSSNKHAAIKSGGVESIEQNHDEGTSSSSCTHPSKKLKIGDDEKLAARQLPLAPTLEAYLINEGHTKYSIRPEWCIGNDNDGVPVEHEWYNRTSSSLPVPSEDRAEPFDRTPPFGPLHDALGLGQHHDRSTNDASFMMMERQAMRAEEYFGEEEINNEEIDIEESVEEDRLRFHQRRRRKRAAGPSFLPDQEEEGQEEEGAAVAAGDPNHSTTELKIAVYGPDYDSALHMAIKQDSEAAALALINNGANVNFPNCKAVTPLMSASLTGNIEIVRALLEKGAAPNAVSSRGSTALIQACHFGKLEVVQELINHGATVDLSNYKNTTALMRASQEGHEDVVKLLLEHHCEVNKRNDERMSALMLSSQRGHARIVKILIKANADVNAVTNQNSTSLMLAVKRQHLEVAKMLVAAGAELNIKDNKGRTALDTARRRELSEIEDILTDQAQIRFMKLNSRNNRNFLMVRSWNLLQSERAFLKITNGTGTSIHQIADNIKDPVLQQVSQSTQALFLTWAMPAPVMELITSFIPLPLIYETRLKLLASRAEVDPDSAVYCTMDLIDEVLEGAHLLKAFDSAKVPPPKSFRSWAAFKKWCGQCDTILAKCHNGNTQGIHSLDEYATFREVSGNSQDQRRSMNYLHLLAHAPPALSQVLFARPFHMPIVLLSKLMNVQDIQTLVRKQSGVHFDTNVANELLTLARMTVNWAESRPYY